MAVNSIAILGNLTRDMEERKPDAVYSFDLAYTMRKKIKGEWKDTPGFINCVIYGKRGRALMPHLKKGTKVAVFGEIEYHAWTGKDGTKRHDTAINVRDLDFMSRKQNKDPEPENYEIPFTE